MKLRSVEEARRLRAFLSKPHEFTGTGHTWEDRIEKVREAKRRDPSLSHRELAMICFEGEGFVRKALCSRDAMPMQLV